MAYALLDENNIVTQVITGKDEGGDTDWEIYYGNITGKTCKKHRTIPVLVLIHQAIIVATKNYAGIGYSYNHEKDAFIPPSRIIVGCFVKRLVVEAPIEQPEAASGVLYVWDENIVN